jgi:class 3 adenylate cyclase
VHTAEATLTEDGYGGKGVHVAARIGALAEGGEVLVSLETIADESSFHMEEPRTVALKGVSEPVQVVAISWK